MAERFDLVVFDWDGTVLDSASAIVQSIVAACRDLGLPEPTEERARYVIGLGLGDALFVEIMNLPEYYLTRCEMDIFQNKTNLPCEDIWFSVLLCSTATTLSQGWTQTNANNSNNNN